LQFRFVRRLPPRHILPHIFIDRLLHDRLYVYRFFASYLFLNLRVDFFRDAILDLLARIAEILQRHPLLHLFDQGWRLDPQAQQTFRVVRFRAELRDIELIEAHRVDAKIVPAARTQSRSECFGSSP